MDFYLRVTCSLWLNFNVHASNKREALKNFDDSLRKKSYESMIDKYLLFIKCLERGVRPLFKAEGIGERKKRFTFTREAILMLACLGISF